MSLAKQAEREQSLEIRPAQPKDIGAILKLDTLWSRELPIPLRISLYGLSKLTNKFGGLERGLKDPNHRVLVAEFPQGIAGYLVGYIIPDREVGWVQAFYVAPERRGGIVAKRLVFVFEEFARSKGCLDLEATVLRDRRTHRLARLMGWYDIREISDYEVWIGKTLGIDKSIIIP